MIYSLSTSALSVWVEGLLPCIGADFFHCSLSETAHSRNMACLSTRLRSRKQNRHAPLAIPADLSLAVEASICNGRNTEIKLGHAAVHGSRCYRRLR